MGDEKICKTSLRRPATLDEWCAAVAEAWGRLCNGHGCNVELGERWHQAIVRVASVLLAEHALGRPRGPVSDEWARAVEAVEARSPCSRDGLVAGPGGLRISLATIREQSRRVHLPA
jgi:hypothetical protein